MSASSPNKGTYAYYCCEKHGCELRKKGTRVEIVHQHFIALLQRVSPGEKLLTLIERSIRIKWKERLEELANDRRRWQQRVTACETEIKGFLEESRHFKPNHQKRAIRPNRAPRCREGGFAG